jgi:carotenoid cleavage dioxygenase-like enzyme
MPYRWDDNYGARLGVLRPDDPYGEIRWFEIDPCYVFHVANAYDDGESIVLQAVRYPELWRDNGGFGNDGVMWRWTINLRGGTVSEKQIDDRGVEFPRIDDRLAGLPARYAVAVGDGTLVRYDLERGRVNERSCGSSGCCGEFGV